MFSYRSAFLAVALSAFCFIAGAGEVLFVQNTNSGDVTRVSIPEHEVAGTIDIGKYTDDVEAAHDQSTLYVNRIDTAGLPQAMNVGESGEVIAVDPLTHEIRWRLELDGMPHHMTVSPDNRYVFVPLFDRLWCAVVDTKEQAVVQMIPVGWGGHGTLLSPDQERLYIGSMMMDHIMVVDVGTRLPVDRITFEDGVRPFVITPDGETMYVQLSRLHGFKIVDLEKGEVVGAKKLPPLPEDIEIPRTFPHTVNHGLGLTPDGKHLFAAASIAGYVAVYTVPELELVTTIPVGEEPNWIVFNELGAYAYVTNRMSDTVSVIDTETMKVIKTVTVGKYPQRMAVVDISDAD